MSKWINVLFISTVALTSGCASVPEYRAPQGAAVARLNIKSQGSKWICVAGQSQRLVADSTGYADIPAGSRLTIGSSYYSSYHNGFGMAHMSCNPRSSIIPEPGQHYYIDFEIESELCYAFIFKEDATNRTGLAFEPTFGPPSDCSGR